MKSPSLIAILVELVLYTGAHLALAYDFLIIPPIMVFFFVDHVIAVSFLVLVIALLELGFRRSAESAVYAAVALVVLLAPIVLPKNSWVVWRSEAKWVSDH